MQRKSLRRREFLKQIGAAALSGAWLAETARAADAPPNVLVILTDDQGWGDLSVHGNSNLHTPNIDSLARDGALFERFFVCPLCAPTRAQFLTARYHPRGGVRGVTRGAERLNLDEKTIAETFKAAGYATAAFGKWHNGTQYPYHPNARGFDEFYGFCSGHWGQYFDPVLEHNGKIVRGRGYIADDLTDHALAFIEEHKSEPFFCYLPYNTPHSPFQVPDEYWNRFEDKPIRLRCREPQKERLDVTRCVLAMCENLDWNVGRLLRKLDELQLADNTIVVYFSDNGPNSWRWNGGMRGRKGSVDEGGVRVPCLVRWTGHIKPGTIISEIAGDIDLLPTLAEMAGIPIIGDKPLDGKSVAPLLLGTAAEWPDRMIFVNQGNRVSVRTQRFRLDNAGRLYDMVADTGQYRDVSGKYPEVAKKLRDAVQRWREEVLPKGPDTRPFPVGYREFPTTFLPARDGVPFGNVKRSAKAPNCSFFTNWISAADKMTWDIEVATPGDYEAFVYYTCPRDDVGSIVELSFRGNRVRATVSEAHDPPLIGAEYDRVPRGSESYVKDFRPLRLGVLRLEKGRGTLTLRAVKVARKQVMDVRAIVLKLL